MKFGDCLVCGVSYELDRPERDIPVSQAGHDLGLDILLDIRPFLSHFRRAIGKQLLEISRFDGGEHTTVLDSVVVLDDWCRSV